MCAYSDALTSERKKSIKEINEVFGFKQIRKTMAFEMIDKKSCNLRSYATDIASFEFGDFPILHVNWRMFDCSATTIRHLGDWLRSHRAIGYDYSDIKRFSKLYEPDDMGNYTGEVFFRSGYNVGVAFDL